MAFTVGGAVSTPMDMGALGAPDIIILRKFRFTFAVQNFCNGLSVPPSFVKIASRPSFTVEETELNYLNAKSWIPGKVSWETITVTYIDVANTNAGQQNIYTWLASVYDFTEPTDAQRGARMGSRRSDYAGQGILTMYDGCGAGLHQWTLNDLWPQAVNFGDLDYASSEESTIELTLRYSAAYYRPLCGIAPSNPCCTSCN